MNENIPTIVTGIVGIVTSIAAWFLGGKQNAKIQKDDVITRGADQIVETSNKLLQKLEQMLEEERNRRTSCENSLLEHKNLIDDLRKEVDELKRSGLINLKK